jgi:Ca-activated chloride channel homolog
MVPWMVTLPIAAVGLVLLVGLGLALWVRRRRRVSTTLGDPHLVIALTGRDLTLIPRLPIGTVLAAAIALGIALNDPSHESPNPPAGSGVVLLLDASGSMLVADLGRPRLEIQREIASRLGEALPERPIGIVAFSGRAYSLAAPTRDAASVQMYLDAVDPTIVTQTGSALGAAIRQGIGLLGTTGGTIILLSDGDETEDRAAGLQAAALARRAGIRVHTVGVGTRAGAPVPAVDLTTGTTAGPLRGPGGAAVTSALDETYLRTLAERGGGVYVDGADGDAVVELMRLLDGDEIPTGRGTLPNWVWFALGALLLLAAEPLGAGRGER